MVWAAVAVGVVSAGVGAYTSIRGQNQAQDAQNAALQANAQAVANVNIAGGFGASGEGTTFTPSGGTVLQLGQLDPARQQLLQTANEALRSVNGDATRLPPELQRALQQANQTGLPGAQLGTLNQIQEGVGQQFGQAQQGLTDQQVNPFARGLEQSSLAGAQGFVNRASQGFDDVRGQTLDLLRQQAAPFEERSFQNLQESQFGTGRAGTSGGGLQTEAFARGLAQADIGRQLQAGQEARNVQSQNLQQAQGLTGLGTGIRGVQDQLLSSAFGRFQQTANLGADFDAQSFNRQLGLNQLGFDRSQNTLQNLFSAETFGQGLQQNQLNLGLQGLQGVAGLNQQASQLGELGLARATLEGNLAVGAGTNTASIVGSPNFNPGGTSDLIGGALTNIGGRIVQAGTAGNDQSFLQNLFGPIN